MNSRTLSVIAVISFLLLGGICWGLRYRALRQERIAREDSLWELTYALQFQALIAEDEMALVTLGLPRDTRHARVNDLTWIIRDPNLHGRDRGPYTLTGNRLLELTTRQDKPAPYDVRVRCVLHITPRTLGGLQAPLESLNTDARLRFLRAEPPIIPTQAPAVRETAQLLPNEAQTEAERLQWIFDFCTDIDSGTGPEAAGDDVQAALSTGRGSAKARARTMVAICRAAGIPARLVTGFKIQQASNVSPHVWVEAFEEPRQQWVPFDTSDGWSHTLPMNYLPVRRDSDEVYTSQNADGVEASYSIRRLGPDEAVLRAGTPHLTQVFDLTRLPVPMHRVTQILLLLPFAALITAIVRNVVGLQTFGTFAPALLAMSFIYADWETGLAILLVVATAGLVGRLFLERLRLLMVPRLSIILTVVILCVVFSVSSFDFLGVTPSADAVLLPMVILTILIERFHVTMEEDGVIFALQLAVGTIIVAALCYLMLGWDKVGALVLTFPEIHFFTVAAFIMLGRYAGYRITELWRFRDLVEPSEPVR